MIVTFVKDIARSVLNSVFPTRDPSILLVKARKARRDGDNQKAIRFVQTCLTSYVNDSEALLFLAGLQVDLQNTVSAHYALSLALDLQPDDADVYYQIGQGYEKMYCLEDAIRAYKLSLEREPGHDQARNALNEARKHLYDWRPPEV